MGNYLPIFITALVPILVIVFIIWLILKLTKSSIGIFGKLLKWGVMVFVAVIIFWALVNILGGSISA